jgi:predicted RNase H-like HicB family nuclease
MSICIAFRCSPGKFPIKKFIATLDRDEDGIWISECPAIPGCVSQGSTRDEAQANIPEAIALCLEVRAERGLPLTIETRPPCEIPPSSFSAIPGPRVPPIPH